MNHSRTNQDIGGPTASSQFSSKVKWWLLMCCSSLWTWWKLIEASLSKEVPEYPKMFSCKILLHRNIRKYLFYHFTLLNFTPLSSQKTGNMTCHPPEVLHFCSCWWSFVIKRREEKKIDKTSDLAQVDWWLSVRGTNLNLSVQSQQTFSCTPTNPHIFVSCSPLPPPPPKPVRNNQVPVLQESWAIWGHLFSMPSCEMFWKRHKDQGIVRWRSENNNPNF